jgi:hypothetical protein
MQQNAAQTQRTRSAKHCQSKRKTLTLFSAILMMLIHQYGPKQCRKCTAARRNGLPSQQRCRESKRKALTLFPANLLMLQHQYGDRQWRKCTGAHGIGLHRRESLFDRQVQAQSCDVDSCDSDGATASPWSQAMTKMHSGAPNRPASARTVPRPPSASANLRR